MINSVIMLSLALLFFAALVYIVYFLSRYFISRKPSKKQIEKDLVKLREEMRPLVAKLVPWNEEEMRLLSLNNSENIKKSIGSKVRKGLMYSIYQEPLIAYAFKGYSEDNYGLLRAVTSTHEYVYRILPSGTEVYVDGNAFGRLISNMELRDPQNERVLARIYDEGNRLIPIIIENQEIGQLVSREEAYKVNPRAYEFLHEMRDNQRLQFMALTLPRLIDPPNEKY